MSKSNLAVVKGDPLPVARYEAMCAAIAECHNVDELKDYHDKARALEVYARQATNVEAERKATEIRLRAERRAGELLAVMDRDTPQQRGAKAGGPGKADPAIVADSPYRSAIERNNIPERTASRWQQLAAVPSAEFERHLKQPDTKPSTTGILRAQNGAVRMDDGALWLWGRLRDLERDGILDRHAADIFGAMTETMQEDVRRVLPSFIDWLSELHEVSR